MVGPVDWQQMPRQSALDPRLGVVDRLAALGAGDPGGDSHRPHPRKEREAVAVVEPRGPTSPASASARRIALR